MKTWLTIIILLTAAWLTALPAAQDEASDKMLDSTFHTAGSLKLETTNLGYINNLTYPQEGSYLLFKGSQWISAKRPRRDGSGNLLYWLSPNPSAQNDQMVTIYDPLWTPGLKMVQDTLTTVGHDGDADINELLPAYNVLNNGNPQVPYGMYNSHDIVLKSILGLPAPRPFVVPDPTGTYCFSLPGGGTFETPGFETNSAYYYDYCPFGARKRREK